MTKPFFVATRLIPHYRRSKEPEQLPHLYTEVIEKSAVSELVDKLHELIEPIGTETDIYDPPVLATEALDLLRDWRKILHVGGSDL